MSGGNQPYVRGYNFERRVRQYLRDNGWFVLRLGMSKFPDLIALRVKNLGPETVTIVWFVECKWNRRLSKKEIDAFKEIKKQLPTVICKVAYHDHKTREIKFADCE